LRSRERIGREQIGPECAGGPEPSREDSRAAAPEEFTLLTNDDLHLFNEGSHLKLSEKLGAHPVSAAGVEGVFFAVFAPNALRVCVMGDFNGWNKESHPLRPRAQSGIWGGFLAGVPVGSAYKFHVVSRYNGYRVDKADPFAFYSETPPKTGSRVWRLDSEWGDSDWLASRARKDYSKLPVSIYELHIGSWRRVPEDGNRPLTYRELARELPNYVSSMGFTHVEFLPLMEHPFYGSWGYQVTGHFAATSRYGTPQDLMFLIDALHQRGIGVILDWVPSHFPSDEHGLGYFDGTYLFEHADPQQGYHPDWESLIFNYGRHEIASFLLSSAFFWIEKFHADGLRVDAVASMLYRDYSRDAGEWVPNEYGGRENLQAISFLRRLNEEIARRHPDVLTIAEESTAWPMVSRPAHLGGLGFQMKWDMGWMHDTLEYMSLDPIHRKFHHDKLTFRRVYAYSENFVLPLSHDEVVHLKGSLAGKMPGDKWQKLANLRLLFGYMYAQPGKKLLFMGGELAQWREWNHDASLDWHLLKDPAHEGVRFWVRDLNLLYAAEACLHEKDFEPEGFDWVDCHDLPHSVVSLLRFGGDPDQSLLAAFNFTPVPRHEYLIGVPHGGFWKEIANSDAAEYGGSGLGNLGGAEALEVPAHGRPYSLRLTLPPLAALFFKGRLEKDEGEKNERAKPEPEKRRQQTSKKREREKGGRDQGKPRAPKPETETP